jgi:hypothetical protein
MNVNKMLGSEQILSFSTIVLKMEYELHLLLILRKGCFLWKSIIKPKFLRRHWISH